MLDLACELLAWQMQQAWRRDAAHRRLVRQALGEDRRPSRLFHGVRRPAWSLDVRASRRENLRNLLWRLRFE
jgi:hypothetical protein